MLDLAMYWNPDKCGEDVVVCLHDLIHLFLLCRWVLCGGHGFCCDLSFILRTNHKEYEFPYLGDYLLALLCCDDRYCSSRNCLWYPVEFISQSNNYTTKYRLIHNMEFPHIWFS